MSSCDKAGKVGLLGSRHGSSVRMGEGTQESARVLATVTYPMCMEQEC